MMQEQMTSNEDPFFLSPMNSGSGKLAYTCNGAATRTQICHTQFNNFKPNCSAK